MPVSSAIGARSYKYHKLIVFQTHYHCTWTISTSIKKKLFCQSFEKLYVTCVNSRLKQSRHVRLSHKLMRKEFIIIYTHY